MKIWSTFYIFYLPKKTTHRFQKPAALFRFVFIHFVRHVWHRHVCHTRSSGIKKDGFAFNQDGFRWQGNHIQIIVNATVKIMQT